jgi:RNA polymerase sigma-70 factor (ECF subfamily)
MQATGPARGIESDASLVDRARAGDFTAFEALFERHRTLVFRFAYQMVGRSDDAEDMTQEVFVRAFQNLSRYRDQARFTTWLLKIASNLAADRARSQGRRAVLEQQQVGEGLRWMTEARHEDPVESLENERMVQAVKAAMASLSPAHREVLYLRDVAELEYKDVAEALGCTTGGAKLRALRARKALRSRVSAILGEDAGE